MALLEFNLISDDQATESSEDLCPLNGNLAEPDYLEGALGELQLRLSELEDSRLVELAIRARHLEWCAFILRGMCACELRRRCRSRLAGGRGKRDHAGEGIQARMMRLAESSGVSPTTLMTDARISNTFFSSVEDTALAREHTLPREYYVIALGAPIPHEAIKIAARYVRDGGRSRERFRAYVRGLKSNSQPCGRGSKVRASSLAQVRVPCAVQIALQEISLLTGKSEAEELAAMIFARHKALSQHNNKTRRKMEETRNAATSEDESPLQLTLTI
jgi:hypothetical protein